MESKTIEYYTTISTYTDIQIKLGEELCTSYCDLFDSYNHREFELSMKYSFDCCCEVCSLDEKRKEEIDMFRERYKNLDDQIIEEGTLDPRRGLELVKKALKTLDKGMLPLVPRLVAKNAFSGFQFALACGNNLDEANKFIQMAYNARYIEGGPEFEETKEMLKYLRNPKTHPLYR